MTLYSNQWSIYNVYMCMQVRREGGREGVREGGRERGCREGGTERGRDGERKGQREGGRVGGWEAAIINRSSGFTTLNRQVAKHSCSRHGDRS